MQDMFTGKELQDNKRYAEAMKNFEAADLESSEAGNEAMPNSVEAEQTDVTQ